MSKDLYYTQEALKLIQRSYLETQNPQRTRMADDLGIPTTRRYVRILNDVDTLLGPDVRLEFASVSNGNLLSKEDSSEMRELVASALTANWRSKLGESKGEDDFLASDISISPYEHKLDIYTTIKPGELFEGTYSISLNRYRKDIHGESHRTGTISALSIIQGLKKIKENYDNLQNIYPHMKRVSDAIKANNSGELTRIVQEITPKTLMTSAEVADTVKFIYETEQKEKRKGILSPLKNLYNKAFKIDSKKQIDDLFMASKSSLTVKDIETGKSTGNITEAQEQAREVVRNRPKASKVSTTAKKGENNAVTADYPPL